MVEGVIGSCTSASRSPLLSDASASSGQTLATPILGSPGSVARVQVPAEGSAALRYRVLVRY